MIRQKSVIISIMSILNIMLFIASICTILLTLHFMKKYEYILKTGFCGSLCVPFIFDTLECLLVIFFAILWKYDSKFLPIFGSKCMVKFNFVASLIGFAMGIYIYIENEKSLLILEENSRHLIQYGRKEAMETIEELQNEFKCCGITSYKDWSKYEEEHHSLPLSCCNNLSFNYAERICNKNSSNLYQKGCLEDFSEYIKVFIEWIIIIKQISLVFQILLVFLYIIIVDKTKPMYSLVQRNDRNSEEIESGTLTNTTLL